MAFRTNKTPVLQTKSASGSIATFNTALAMPLVNGEFTIEAYQEGSGDPSPVNVRNIVPWREVNITHTHKNLCNESELIGRQAIGEHGELVDNAGYKSSQLIPIKNNLYLVLSSPNLNERTQGSFNAVMRFAFYDISGNFISRTGALNGTAVYTQTPINTCFVRFQCGYFAEDIQLEVGSTATDYEPYIVPEVKTVALGEDTYGAVYNSVTGKKIKNVGLKTFVGNDSEAWAMSASQSYISANITDMLASTGYKGLCNYIPVINTIGNGITIGENSKRVYIGAQFLNSINVSTLEDWKTYLADHNLIVTYPLATPIETDLDPTLIETYDGSNNIFCDTGDVDLTYKDLDIAKRGSFREVFKLPS